MSKTEQNGLDALDDIVQGLELLRSQIADLEAMAHAAGLFLEHVPYVPRSRDRAQETQETEQESTRRQLGRLQSLVAATAGSAYGALLAVEVLLEKAQKLPERYAKLKNGNGSSHAREDIAPYACGSPTMRVAA